MPDAVRHRSRDSRVQGDLLTDHGREVPAHEALVEIPVALIRKAIRDNLV
ncbi:hypothetical protein GCM10023083_78860 [Streptomyces phyllanthi]